MIIFACSTPNQIRGRSAARRSATAPEGLLDRSVAGRSGDRIPLETKPAPPTCQTPEGLPIRLAP
jgi:hypothetical protein